MKKDYTDIILVLDRSGSMDSVRSDTIGGVNMFINEQKAAPGEACFTLFQFNDAYERILNAIPVKQAGALTEQSFVPRGNTCLYGAIGCAIHETGERFKHMPEDQRPEKVVFVIVTDGFENSSHLNEWSRGHTASTIKGDIERQSSVYKWHFVFIGANQDAILNAATMGIPASHALNYTHNKVGSEKLYKGLSANVSGMRANTKADMSWENTQRQEQDDAQTV